MHRTRCLQSRHTPSPPRSHPPRTQAIRGCRAAPPSLHRTRTRRSASPRRNPRQAPPHARVKRQLDEPAVILALDGEDALQQDRPVLPLNLLPPVALRLEHVGSSLTVACGLIIAMCRTTNVVDYNTTRPLHKAAPAGNMGHRGLPLSLPSPIRHPCEPHHRAYCTALAIAVTLPPLSLPSHHPGMKRPSRGIEPPRGSFPSLYRVISRASP